jgi:predicted DNA-binding protein
MEALNLSPGCTKATLPRSRWRPRFAGPLKRGVPVCEGETCENCFMTVTIEIPEDIEARLQSEARASGVPFPQLLRDVLIEHLKDTEDRQIAEQRLKNPQTPISSSQMRRNLGLDN